MPGCVRAARGARRRLENRKPIHLARPQSRGGPLSYLRGNTWARTAWTRRRPSFTSSQAVAAVLVSAPTCPVVRLRLMPLDCGDTASISDRTNASSADIGTWATSQRESSPGWLLRPSTTPLFLWLQNSKGTTDDRWPGSPGAVPWAHSRG